MISRVSVGRYDLPLQITVESARQLNSDPVARFTINLKKPLGPSATFEPKLATREVVATVQRALDQWPAAAEGLLGERWAKTLLDRLASLKLVQEIIG